MGVKVILKPTDFQNDQVIMSAMRFGGQAVYGDADKFNAYYANGVAWAMGVGDYVPGDVLRILSGKTARISTGSSPFTDQINGSSGSGDIESMLQQLYLRMTKPRIDQTLYSAFISNRQDAAKNALVRPEAVFQDALQSAIYGDNPRLNRLARPEDFNKINRDRAMAIYGERFGSAKGMTFIFVGSFTVAKIKPLLETYLASLPVSPVDAEVHDMGIRPVTGVVKKEIRAGSEPKSDVTITFSGPATYSLAENMRFHVLIEIMNLKIIDEIREKMSLIYGGGMSGAFDRVPYQNYRISASLPCGPENVDKVIAAMFAEIDKIKRDGPRPADLDKVKLAAHEDRKIAIRTNGHWLTYLQDSVLYGTDPTDILTYDKRLNDVTADDIKEAAKRYFNSSNYVQVVLNPETVAAK